MLSYGDIAAIVADPWNSFGQGEVFAPVSAIAASAAEATAR